MIAFTPDSFTLLENFGHSLKVPSYLGRPKSTEEIADVFRIAKSRNITVTVRGSGLSYNDAALNGGGIVLDLCDMNSILAWDPNSGIITVEPGVSLWHLWQKVIPDGWWPPVVSGTMRTTLGGCLGANIHGKNNYSMGTIGEHVLEFSALLPSGAEVTCSPQKNGDLFHAMIGSLGLLGIFTSITLQMKRVFSGLLKVQAWGVPEFETHLEEIGRYAPEHNYIVGWLDATARGSRLGRGQLHTADYLMEGEDPDPAKTLSLGYQALPEKFFGIVPKRFLHHFMAPFMNNGGAWGVNTLKYHLGKRRQVYHQTHAAFHFLLDYVPGWELAYGQGGLIQYQSFLPGGTALQVWREMLSISHKRSLPSFLGVTKRHRPDSFLLSHAVDGYSLALDFKVTSSNRAGLARMLQDFDRLILSAGGRFYFAKNSETTAATTRRFLGKASIEKFQGFKNRCDPDLILESDLYRRIFNTQSDL